MEPCRFSHIEKGVGSDDSPRKPFASVMAGDYPRCRRVTGYPECLHLDEHYAPAPE